MVFPPSRLGLFSFSKISVPRPESLLLSTSESMLTPPHDTILEFDDTCDTWERVVKTDLHLIFHRTIHVYVAPCKEIQESLELCRFHAVNWFRILGTGFQGPGFWIPKAKISQIPKCGFLYMGRHMRYWSSVRSRWLNIGQVFFFAFLWTEVVKNAKKDLDVIQPSWPNKLSQ